MAFDFWSSKYHSAKHFSASLHSDSHFVLDEVEGDDDARACFPCPFCYVDIEIQLLCTHLQEEHCYDLKNAVCPLCAANLGKDATGHFMVQHASSLKRRRKSLKSGFWTTGSASLGKELSSFLYSSSKGSMQESGPDPLLSPFLCNFSPSDPEDVRQDEGSHDHASVTSITKSRKQSLMDGSEEDNAEKRQKAEFVQQLVASTVF